MKTYILFFIIVLLGAVTQVGAQANSNYADPDMNIPMGSVSLQDYPEKNTTCNSYNSSSPEATPVIEEAIVITNSEKREILRE